MCRPVTCRTCGKTTWAGCGHHIASVKAVVPKENWCDGHAKDEREPSGSWIKRLFG